MDPDQDPDRGQPKVTGKRLNTEKYLYLLTSSEKNSKRKIQRLNSLFRIPTIVNRRRPSASTAVAEAPSSEMEEDVHAASEPELKPEKSLKNIREVGPASSSEPARFLEAIAGGSSSNRFEHFKAKVVFT
jgi:hypothetical protein